jgi:putative ubiquitin-RnfH superfamily antitoxin RatB of RatAB toxin-antitoxin module
MSRRKRCMVAYATRERQHLWSVELPAQGSVADALEAARRQAGQEGVVDAIAWDTAPVGIYGEPCARSAIPADGDRIEIYRPLAADPRERRRARSRKPSR